MAFEIQAIESAAGLRGLEDEWEALQRASVPRNPFVGYHWTSACLAHNCHGARPLVLTARSGGRLVGVAPLCVERRLAFRVLRFIGDGRSDYLGFLRAPDVGGVERVMLEALAGMSGRWDLALLRQLTDEYTGLHGAEVPEALRSRGIVGTVAPHLTLGSDWHGFCSAGPSSLRRSKRAAKKFAKEGGRIERYTGAEAAERVNEVAAVEAASWKGREGAARFQPGHGQRLLQQALTALPEEMELWLAWSGSQPAAFQINFVTPERLCYYQGSYHESFRKLYPGMVLHYHCMERAWRGGLREYDFMSGDEAYKSGWTDAERSVRYLALFPACARGYAAYLTLVAPRWRLKGSRSAKAALQWWVRVRSNPASLLAPEG